MEEGNYSANPSRESLSGYGSRPQSPSRRPQSPSKKIHSPLMSPTRALTRSRRENRQSSLVKRLFKLTRSKSNNDLRSHGAQRAIDDYRRSITGSVNNIGNKSNNSSLKTFRQTLFEKKASSVSNSTLSKLNNSFTQSQNFVRSGISSQELNRLQKMNIVHVAPEDLVEDDEDAELRMTDIKIKFSGWIINPYGAIARSLNIGSLILLLTILFLYPIRLCFEQRTDDNLSWAYKWLPFDLFVDLVCVADIILNFFIPYENVSNILVTSHKAIAKRYARKYLVTDILGLLPINPLLFPVPGAEYGKAGVQNSNYIVWRIFRLVKILKIFKVNKQLEICLLNFKRTFEEIKIVKFVLDLLMVIHLTACFWNLLGEIELRDSWIEIGMTRYESVMSKYMKCIYFSFTVLLTVGYGNISADNTIERVFLIIWMFFGVILYAYIIGSFSSVFGRINKSKTSRNERELFYTNLGRTLKLPEQVLDQVLATIGVESLDSDTGWLQIYETNRILAELPKSLYGDICTYVYRELIEAIDFLQNKPKHFLIRILPLLKPYNLSYCDEVYKHGDPANEVFFIHKGRIASICFDSLGKLRSLVFVQGSYFGECDILYKRARTSTAFAESKVTLWKLNKSEFLSILEEFPDVNKEIMASARIKEMYRAPVVPRRQNKLRELIYAKQILKRTRSILANNRKGALAAQTSLEKKAGSFSFLPEEEARLEVNGVGHMIKGAAFSLMNIETRSQGDFEDYEDSRKPKYHTAGSLSLLRTPQTLRAQRNLSLDNMPKSPPDLQKSTHSEEYLPPQGSPLVDHSILKESPGVAKGTSAYFLFEEQKTQLNPNPSPALFKPQAVKSNTERINAKVAEILSSKDCAIDNLGILEMLIGGKDTVLEYDKQFESTSDKTALEIEEFVDSESRISHSVNEYQEYLTQLVRCSFSS